MALCAIGCSSGGNAPGGGNGGGGGGTPVTVNFINGTPLAFATQAGTPGFVSAAPSNQVTFTVPSGTTKYAFAALCPQHTVFDGEVFEGINPEIVLEATIQDGTTWTEDCQVSNTQNGSVSGTVNTTISGTSIIFVFIRNGRLDILTTPPSSATFNGTAQIGMDDIGVVSLDASNNTIGVKIVRSQTVPGAISPINLVSPR